MKIIMPWKNLGCLAIKTRRYYADIFVFPHFGLYVHDLDRAVQTWYKLPSFRVLRVHVRGVRVRRPS